MPFRRIVFWTHLVAGLVAGAVIAIMSATGIAIAFEEEMLAWFDRRVSRIEEPSGSLLPVAELVTRIEAQRPGFFATSVTVSNDPLAAYEFHAGREGPLYVDPYTGVARDSQAHRAHEVIHKLEEWHRWLGAKDGVNSAARLVTGASNLAFVVLCVTGLYLWFPRRWSRRALRPLLVLVPGSRGKARDYNWHTVLGFWSLPVLFVLAVTAVPISFEWGHRLVFVLAGEEPPKARNYGMMAVPPPVVPRPATNAVPLAAEAWIASLRREFPESRKIQVQLPGDISPATPKPVNGGVTLPDNMPSRAYVPVAIDPFTGEVLEAVRFTERSTGLQARVWIRFLHTGAAFGVPGKIIATLATALSLVLVWTGLALSWRRFFSRRRSGVAEPAR